MKATFLLRRDHARILSSFEACLQAEDDSRPAHFQRTRDLLLVHLRVEEDLYYPALETVPELREAARLAREEHRDLRLSLQRFDGVTFNDTSLRLLHDLRDTFERHVETEEEDLFARSRRALGDARIEELGRQIEARRLQLLEAAPA
jgi:hypothetical protein